MRNNHPDGFCRYELRTTDVDAARAFYAGLLGPDFWGEGIDVQPMPPQSAERGAPSHWLGHIGVDDVVGTALRFIDAGAALIGQPPGAPVPSERAILRDPFGAFLALTSDRTAADADRVPWHMLLARDEAQAFDVYRRFFGWTPVESVNTRLREERLQLFHWDLARHGGATTNAASLPHVHPQWLFFFRTANLTASLATVREWGGLTLPVTVTPEGWRLAACDDPQGAAFGLYEDARH